jgi:hypothetical protein
MQKPRALKSRGPVHAPEINNPPKLPWKQTTTSTTNLQNNKTKNNKTKNNKTTTKTKTQVTNVGSKSSCDDRTLEQVDPTHHQACKWANEATLASRYVIRAIWYEYM